MTIDKLSEDNVSAVCIWPMEGCGAPEGAFLGSTGSQGLFDLEKLQAKGLWPQPDTGDRWLGRMVRTWRSAGAAGEGQAGHTLPRHPQETLC